MRSSLENPAIWSDPNKIKQISKQIKSDEEIVGAVDDLSTELHYIAEILNLDGEADDLTRQAIAGLDLIEPRLRKIAERTHGPDDHKPAFLTVQAGSGGREACNWAQMLLRMYGKRADKLGLTYSLVDVAPHEPDGINSVTIRIDGDLAYGRFKGETGVHRLSRVSPFDQADRRQTSFASVDVIPEAEQEQEFAIPEKDLDVYYCCGGGNGGQAINKTEVVAVVKHLPTGIIVRSQATRYQQHNKEIAMQILMAKLIRRKEEEAQVEALQQKALAPKAAFGSEYRRSYVLSQHPAIHDHKTEKSTTKVDEVMNGNLEDLY